MPTRPGCSGAEAGLGGGVVDRSRTAQGAARPGSAAKAGLTRRLTVCTHLDPDPADEPRRPAPVAPVVVSIKSTMRDAARRLGRALAGVQPAAVLLFASPGSVLPRLAMQLRAELGDGCTVLGCSSAGEFALAGYQTGTVVAVGFPASSFRVAPIWLRNLSGLAVSDWIATLRAHSRAFDANPARASFGLLLIDGLSQQEELVAATVDTALPGLPVLGGSSGDGLLFKSTSLVLNGESHGCSALFCLFETDFCIEEVIFDHFSPSQTRMIVTRAVPEDRLILEINAEPAVEEYARLIDVPASDLNHHIFASHPMLVRIGGQHFVRAIRETTPEGGLRLMSSIETGMILTLGRAEDLTHGFEARLRALPGRAVLILSFDCILRRLALEQAGLNEDVQRINRDYRIAGFNTYGEQHGGYHVNQTFVGLAFLLPESCNAA